MGIQVFKYYIFLYYSYGILLNNVVFQSLVAFPKLKRQLLICHPEVQSPRDFTENAIFSVNQDFSLMLVFFLFIVYID